MVPKGLKWGAKGSKEGPKEAKRNPKTVPRATPGPNMAPLGAFSVKILQNNKIIHPKLVPRSVKVGKAEISKIIEKPLVFI